MRKRTEVGMGNDAALRSCLMWLAAVIIVVGLCTHSFKKMVVTYFMGIAAIAGVLLPDWDFFDRDISQWTKPVTVDEITLDHLHRKGSQRFRFYPMRTVIYTLVYGFGLYKWWTYVTQ